MLEKNGIKNVTNYINQQSYYEKSEKVPKSRNIIPLTSSFCKIFTLAVIRRC